MRWPRSLAALVWASMACACTVTPPPHGVWTCRTDEDCAGGYRCSARAGDAALTCQLACDSSEDCPDDFVCSPAGTCAQRCTFTGVGNDRGGCPTGLSCERLRYPLGADPEPQGLCVTVDTCTANDDCPANQRCASYDSTMLRGLTNLPCVPTVSASGCPAGWVGTSLGCLANCDPAIGSIACAPGMSCYIGALVPVGARESESGCYFGFYGASCRDDTECFVGRCSDLGGGVRQCTETCDDAARLSLEPRAAACGALLDRAGPLGARLVFTCSGDDASAICVARGGVGSGCRSEGTGPDAECADGLECREGLCTRPCASDADCVLASATQNDLASGYCDPDSGLCRRRLDLGALCDLDAECTTGLCAPPLPTAEFRCDRQRRPSQLCTRDAECLSGRCVGGRMGMSLRICE